jgi:hypothetical protein
METVTHRAMQSGVPGTRLLRDGVVELKQKSELAAGRRKGPEAVTEQVRN